MDRGAWLWSIGSQRVSNSWRDLTCMHRLSTSAVDLEIFMGCLIYICILTVDGKGQAIRYIFLKKKKSVDLFNECHQCFFIHSTSSLLNCLFPTCNQTKGSPGGSVVKNPPVMQEMRVQFLGQENSLEKETATHSSILAWRIPWAEEPGGHMHGVTNSAWGHKQ